SSCRFVERDSAISQAHLEEARTKQGDSSGLVSAQLNVIAVLKKLADEDKGSVIVEKDLAFWYEKLANSYVWIVDKVADGLDAARAGRVVAEGLLARGVNDGIVLDAYGLLLMNEGVALMVQKRYTDAIKTFELMDKTFVELATRDLGDRNHLQH